MGGTGARTKDGLADVAVGVSAIALAKCSQSESKILPRVGVGSDGTLGVFRFAETEAAA